jgi:hypothetical protein
MQTVSVATEIVSYITGTHRGRASQMARALIDAGILPKSSGRDIKKISAKELLPLLAAVAMADKVADAAEIARQFAALPFEGKAEDGTTLADMFVAVMERDVWSGAEIEFSKQHSGYAASIRGRLLKDGEEALNVDFPFWRDPSWGHFCKTSFTISAEGVEIMRNLFARDDIEGVSYRLSTGEAAP